MEKNIVNTIIQSLRKKKGFDDWWESIDSDTKNDIVIELVTKVRLNLKEEQNSWKSVSEEIPPSHVELLVKSPEGVVHLSSWRESYNIFTCQTKSESSFNWEWKTI